MAEFELTEHSHRRFNPLSREWVLVSPHRNERPWLGQIEKLPVQKPPAYDPGCYMCPGNPRATGETNPRYEGTFVFENDYAALVPNTPESAIDEGGLIVARGERGMCRVLCFSPRHDLTISTMTWQQRRRVVDDWAEQYQELGTHALINYVQIFENRGAMMGASNPHPHCQIWASENLPNEPAKEQQSSASYKASHHACMLCDYLKIERTRGERMIFENEHFVALVPFWAIWPFEVMLISRNHLGALPDFTEAERDGLAEALKRITARYDNLFDVPFPYSMGFHQRPTDGAPHPEWHFHAHFYPPLLRSANVRKFMVGYEMLGTPQRDITPESAAATLRELQETLEGEVQ